MFRSGTGRPDPLLAAGRKLLGERREMHSCFRQAQNPRFRGGSYGTLNVFGQGRPAAKSSRFPIVVCAIARIASRVKNAW